MRLTFSIIPPRNLAVGPRGVCVSKTCVVLSIGGRKCIRGHPVRELFGRHGCKLNGCLHGAEVTLTG